MTAYRRRKLPRKPWRDEKPTTRSWAFALWGRDDRRPGEHGLGGLLIRNPDQLRQEFIGFRCVAHEVECAAVLWKIGIRFGFNGGAHKEFAVGVAAHLKFQCAAPEVRAESAQLEYPCSLRSGLKERLHDCRSSLQLIGDLISAGVAASRDRACAAGCTDPNMPQVFVNLNL